MAAIVRHWAKKPKYFQFLAHILPDSAFRGCLNSTLPPKVEGWRHGHLAHDFMRHRHLARDFVGRAPLLPFGPAEEFANFFLSIFLLLFWIKLGMLCFAKFNSKPNHLICSSNMDHRQALNEVQSIRLALSASQTWCCFRAITIALTGVTGIVAGILQPFFVSDIAQHAWMFVGYWFAVAVLNLTAVYLEIVWRAHRFPSLLVQGQSRSILLQFLPSLLIGSIATLALLSRAPDLVVLLPGLWCLFFAAGIFACLRNMPDGLGWVALYYASAGALLCIFASATWLESGAAVGLSFGLGQIATGGILWRKQGHEFC
jgi:hypothetical protein